MLLASAASAAGVAVLAGCGRGKSSSKEIAYVSAPQAFLRDQVAAVYNKTGTVKNGEAVQVLGRDRRFARVRTSTGAEGWLEQRYLVDQGNLRRLPEAGGTDAQRARAGDWTSRTTRPISILSRNAMPTISTRWTRGRSYRS